MQLSSADERRAVTLWLRTGRWPTVRSANGLELKFNPYHDRQNGRFTFGPGGSRDTWRSARLAAGRIEEPAGRGSNSRAFEDPMTLEHVAPALRGSPAGAVVAIADDFFNIFGNADAAQIEIIDGRANKALADIKRLDPHFHFNDLGPNTTVEGRQNRLNDILMHRAAIYLRVRGDYGPLQVETLKLVQKKADDAYTRGQELLARGKLTHGTTDRMKLGNYIDREVRKDVRERFFFYGVKVSSDGRVRVNRQENGVSGRDYSVPDIRVDRFYYDVSLQAKRPGAEQIVRYFGTKANPEYVIIVRPRQEAPNHSYIIKR